MQPLHDKDLDRLSREAAELFEVDSGASGWDNLEKRLDVELPQKKKKRRFLFWLFFITATTGGALIGIMKYQPVIPLAKNATGVVSNTPSTGANMNEAVTEHATTGNNSTPGSGAQTPATESSTVTTTPAAESNQPAPAALNTTTPDKENNTTAPVTQPGKTITKSVTRKTDKTKLALNYASITPDHVGSSSEPININKNSKRKPVKKQKTTAGQHKQTVRQGRNTIYEPVTQVADTDEAVSTNQADQSTAQQTPADASAPVKKDAAAVPAVTDSAKTPAAPIVKKEPEKKQDKKVKGLELGLMAGPDLSTVKFGPVYKPGYNFGVQVGYRFSNRWSVNTGVIYTKKFYKADSSNFNYKMPWNYKVKNAEGNCSMLELPVNVRYDISYNDKRRWFASTGLSTYFMNNEYYDIYYTYNGNPYQQPYNVDSNTNSNYWFSILNLSVGMERSLGKRFSLQAEPYLKVPLKDLGIGNIRMTSYGILFTLKYKPQFNSKRSDTRK